MTEESKALTAPIPIADIRQMAEAVAKSQLFGMKTPEQAMALMLIAHAEGLHPAIAARDYHIIQGRPSKSAEAMQRSFLALGGRIEWHELTDEKCSATFSHPQGGSATITWDMTRAKKAGLTEKNGSMFLKYPRPMLRARVISEGVRTIHPGATSGMYTPEEVREFEPRKQRRAEAMTATNHNPDAPWTGEELFGHGKKWNDKPWKEIPPDGLLWIVNESNLPDAIKKKAQLEVDRRLGEEAVTAQNAPTADVVEAEETQEEMSK
jgi:hypothetical protein